MITPIYQTKFKYGDYVRCANVTEGNPEKLVVGNLYRILGASIIDGNEVYALFDLSDESIHYSMDHFEYVGNEESMKVEHIHLALEKVDPVPVDGKTQDMVNHPAHYTHYKWEVIDIIEEVTKDMTGIEAVAIGNAIKYIMRCKLKGREVEDLRKAVWYLNKAADYMEAKDGV